MTRIVSKDYSCPMLQESPKFRCFWAPAFQLFLSAELQESPKSNPHSQGLRVWSGALPTGAASNCPWTLPSVSLSLQASEWGGPFIHAGVHPPSQMPWVNSKQDETPLGFPGSICPGGEQSEAQGNQIGHQSQSRESP